MSVVFKNVVYRGATETAETVFVLMYNRSRVAFCVAVRTFSLDTMGRGRLHEYSRDKGVAVPIGTV